MYIHNTPSYECMHMGTPLRYMSWSRKATPECDRFHNLSRGRKRRDTNNVSFLHTAYNVNSRDAQSNGNLEYVAERTGCHRRDMPI